MPTADLLAWADAQPRTGAFGVNPTVTTEGVPAVGWYHGFLEVKQSGRKLTLTESSGGNRTWINVTSSNQWIGWKLQALATPPQEFDLPLAEGYTASGGCKYSKDQFGIVRVVGNINKSSGTFASNTPFATLPAGFRPGRYGGFVAIANSLPVEASKRHPAVVQVSVDGNITISMMSETDQTAFQQIIFAIQFLAAD